jgi:hypothetical protein
MNSKLDCGHQSSIRFKKKPNRTVRKNLFNIIGQVSNDNARMVMGVSRSQY